MLQLRLKQRPYNLLLLTAVGLLLTGIFRFKTLVILYVRTKHYFFSLAYYIWTPALILLSFWLLYRATKNILFSKALSWTHILLTLFSCLLIFIFPFLFKWFNEDLAGFPRHYYDTDQKVFEGYIFWTRKLAVLGLILTAGQLTYLWKS